MPPPLLSHRSSASGSPHNREAVSMPGSTDMRHTPSVVPCIAPRFFRSLLLLLACVSSAAALGGTWRLVCPAKRARELCLNGSTRILNVSAPTSNSKQARQYFMLPSHVLPQRGATALGCWLKWLAMIAQLRAEDWD